MTSAGRIPGSKTIKKAIVALQASFASKISTSRIMETGHRSILVMDRSGHVQSILAITDIMVLGQSFQRCLHML